MSNENIVRCENCGQLHFADDLVVYGDSSGRAYAYCTNCTEPMAIDVSGTDRENDYDGDE
jgi:hypothetical protein